MLESYWYIACRSKELGEKPLGVTILQKHAVVFRTYDGKVAALEDRCAHRNAPLSQGKVCEGQLECPYHGWRYSADGKAAQIPALPENCLSADNYSVKSYNCLEQDGYMWVCLGATPARQRPLEFPHFQEGGWTSFKMKTRMQAAVETCLENFLDCPHASYVHRFWFRTPKTKPVRAIVRTLPDGAVAEYFEEPRETSLVWWLLTRKKSQMKHTDRFIAPSTSRVDYIFDDDRHYIITSSCTPVSETETEVHTVITFKVGRIGWLIRLFFEPLSRLIIGQDVKILKLQQENITRFGKAAYKFIPADVLGLDIIKWRQAIQTGTAPPAAGEERCVEMRL